MLLDCLMTFRFVQVKQKLNAAEYKEFVGFMKALKSKAIQIGSVLQSVMKLFSGPERRPLLEWYLNSPLFSYREIEH